MSAHPDESQRPLFVIIDGNYYAYRFFHGSHPFVGLTGSQPECAWRWQIYCAIFASIAK